MKRRTSYEVMNSEDILREVTRWIADVVMVVSLALFLTYMFGTRVQMEGNSMATTLSDGDRLLLNRFSGKLMGIERYDILVYRLNDEDSVYLKRVVGLPGETVQIRDGLVYIDGEPLTGDVLLSGIAFAGVAEEPLTLGAGEYFVLGENPDGSLDSRYSNVGNIPLDHVLGTCWLRSYPLSGLKFF